MNDQDKDTKMRTPTRKPCDREPDLCEEWRDAPGYEGCYQVSDRGRVRSVPRMIVDLGGKRRRTVGGSVLKGSQHPKGYRMVRCRDSAGNSGLVLIHHLVLSAFVGPRPDGMVTRHLNGNPTDNRLANLVYGTPSENSADMHMHGTNHWSNQTHCVRGHRFDAANTRTYRGKRICRACERIRAQERNGSR